MQLGLAHVPAIPLVGGHAAKDRVRAARPIRLQTHNRAAQARQGGMRIAAGMGNGPILFGGRKFVAGGHAALESLLHGF